MEAFWFQHDDAKCHITKGPMGLWCGLQYRAMTHYTLWNYVNAFAYADTPESIDAFEENIRRFIADYGPDGYKNW